MFFYDVIVRLSFSNTINNSSISNTVQSESYICNIYQEK